MWCTMLRLGVIRIYFRSCDLCSGTLTCSPYSKLYLQSVRAFQKYDWKLCNKRKALQFAGGQALLDSLPESALKKMQISLKTTACSSFWQTHVTIKWPESRSFYVRASSKEDVENRIYEMLYKYLVRKNVIGAANSSILEVENKVIVNHAQETIKDLWRSESNLLAARRVNSAAAIVGGANMFKKHISSLLKQERDDRLLKQDCDSTLIRMMHDLTITSDNSDKNPERIVTLKKTRRNKSDDTASNSSADDPSRKRRKVELSEGSSTSLTVTCSNDVIIQEETSLASKRSKRKSNKAKESTAILKRPPYFRHPKSYLYQFYEKVASKMNSEDYNLKISYEEKSRSPQQWECTMQVKWPEPSLFIGIKQSKALAATQASLLAVEWLHSLGRISSKGAPIFSNLEMVTPPAEMSLDLNAVKKPIQLTDTYTQAIGPQLSSDSKNDPLKILTTTSNNVNIKMESDNEAATSSKSEVEQAIKEQQVDKGLRDVEIRFPYPTSIIHQFCQSLASSLGSEDHNLKLKYERISEAPSRWQCSLQMKWPEPKTFIAIKQSKSLAAKEVSLLALQWLHSIGKITKQGLPIIYDPKHVERSAAVEVSVDLEVVQAAQQLVDAYIQFVKPQLEDCDLLNDLSKELGKESDTDLQSGTEHQFEKELFACGERRNPVTGRIMHEVSKEALNKRNSELYRRSQSRKNKTMQGKLPIMAFRESILEMLENNRVLVIKGQPGCGKSTMVPQFIMENFEAEKQGANCNIVVTQPRRISAISLAEWVAREREEMLGDVVGYQVRLKNVLPRSVGGAILFCSTGILLRRLVSNPGLFGASHIIVDEAHERDINTDFLLILLRRALKLNPDLKVIVMSATINAELFQNYFNGAAAINVPGFTYPVKSVFMDNFAEHNIPVKCNTNQECPSVNVKAVAELVQWINRNRETDGAILCFLPGWAQIKQISSLLDSDRELMVLPAHSKLNYKEQKKIFQPPLPGTRKVILSTNIAETSITINDVEFVIDTGLHREYRLDADKGLPTFGNHWISKASVNQRRGRAGRVKPGESFHLYTTKQYEKMEQFPLPEILRIPLEKTVLDCKAYSREEKAAEFLSQMPEPPTIQAVEHAVSELMLLDALDSEENLTALGKRIALFTVHPKLSVALIHAAILRCLNPIVTVASIFGNDIELFYGSLTDKGVIKSAKKAYHPTSDHLAISWLYQQWETLNNESAQKALNFCYPRKLQPEQMELVEKLRHLISEHLQECAILKDKRSFANLEAECNMYAGNDELVKGVLLSSFGTLMLSQDFDWRNGRLVKQKVLVSDNGNRVSLGSESVNHGRTNFMSKFLTHFQETRLTESRVVMVRETTMVSPLTVLLFVPGEFEVTDIHPKNEKWDGYVLLKHKRKRKVRLIMKEQEAILFLELRRVLWNIVQYFILKEGVAGEDIDRYKSISAFHKDLLQALSDMMLKAGAAIEYKDGILVD